jgi:hypothetical protein
MGTYWSDLLSSILLTPKRKKKEKKKERKGTPPWYQNVGGHPIESVSHGLGKEKRWGGVPSFIKRAQKCQSLSQKLASFLYGT